MTRSTGRWALALWAALFVCLPAGLAWACVGVVSLTVPAKTVQPGDRVTVVGREFAEGSPVEIHLDSSTGPLLATAPAPTETMTSRFSIQVPVPENLSKGEHLLVATQQYHYMNSGSPARAAIYVGVPVAAEPGAAPRPSSLNVDTGPGTAELILIAVGVAAGGLLLAGLTAFAATRRNGPPGRPESVQST